MKSQCSCCGTNPNCRWCNGSGYGGRYSRNRSSIAFRPAPQPRDLSHLQQCPYCKARVRSIAKHTPKCPEQRRILASQSAECSRVDPPEAALPNELPRSSSHAPPTSGTATLSSVSSPKESREVLVWKCPHCQAFLGQDCSRSIAYELYLGHFEAAHKRLVSTKPARGAGASSPRQSSKGNSRPVRSADKRSAKARKPPLVECAICGVSLRADNRAKHNAKVHGKPGGRPGPQKTTGIQSLHRGDERTTSDETTQHPARLGLSRARSRSNEIAGHLKEAVEQKASSNTSAAPRDGASGYWQYREAGKFGSHPSFDRFDEESEP